MLLTPWLQYEAFFCPIYYNKFRTSLKRAIITTEDDGTIINIEDTLGDLKEKHSVEFYNGIIIPGL